MSSAPFFELRTELYFGCGERKNLSKYLGERNLSRCGVVIDAAVVELDIYKDLLDHLKKEMEHVSILAYDHKGEPTYAYLDSVKDYFAQDGLDCVIGIGGGSAMDTAKGLALLLTNPTDQSVNFRGFPTDINKPLSVITIPTIAGTGSEATYNAVFIDEGETRKLGINTTDNFPTFSVVDPELALSAPIRQTLSSALDSMVHALESFMSTKATFVTRPFSIQAFKFAIEGIEKVLKDPQDVEGRTNLFRASYLAGVAYFNSSAGPAAAMSYPLGTFKKVPHGEAGAFFMQYVLPYNLKGGYTDFYLLYDAINPDENTLSREEKSKKLVNYLVDLIERSNIPKTFSELGATEEDVKLMFNQVKDNLWANVEFNPVAMNEKELNQLLMEIL